MTPCRDFTEQGGSKNLQLALLSAIEVQRIQTRQDWNAVKPRCLRPRRAALLFQGRQLPVEARHCSSDLTGAVQHLLTCPRIKVGNRVSDDLAAETPEDWTSPRDPQPLKSRLTDAQVVGCLGSAKISLCHFDALAGLTSGGASPFRATCEGMRV
jgi:hypothetical protein